MRERLTQMWKVKRVVGIGYGADHMGEVMLEAAAQVAFGRRNEEGQEGQKVSPKVVIVCLASPGSGKTTILGMVDEVLIDLMPKVQDSEQSVTPPRFISLKYEDAEDRTRDKGELTTSDEQPHTLEERIATDRNLRSMVIEAFPKADVIKLELPSDSATRRDNIPPIKPEHLTRHPIEIYDKWMGRFLGSETLYELLCHEGKFKSENYTVFIIGLEAGELLQTYVLLSREEVKRASTLFELQFVASRWGLPVPKTEEEAFRLKREGASLEAMLNIKRQKVLLASLLCANKVLELPKGVNFLSGKDPVYIQRVLETHPHMLNRVEAAILVKIIRVDLGISDEVARRTVCIGRNDPEVSDFKVDVDRPTPSVLPRPTSLRMERNKRSWKNAVRNRQSSDHGRSVT
ncbi:MAG: hypothetical protein HY376_03830 [Candidatus Blackburnbacteria bacterium]|nr:hypothetical protein [Candidatus Blackburnbacteria bacterium]